MFSQSTNSVFNTNPTPFNAGFGLGNGLTQTTHQTPFGSPFTKQFVNPFTPQTQNIQHTSQQTDQITSTITQQNKSNLEIILGDTQVIQREILEELKKVNTTIATVLNTDSKVNQTNTKTNEHIEIVHIGITCDSCFKQNITGTRWKCLFCKDFDVCDTCEKNGFCNTHSAFSNHVFIKIDNTTTFNTKLAENPVTFLDYKVVGETQHFQK